MHNAKASSLPPWGTSKAWTATHPQKPGAKKFWTQPAAAWDWEETRLGKWLSRRKETRAHHYSKISTAALQTSTGSNRLLIVGLTRRLQNRVQDRENWQRLLRRKQRVLRPVLGVGRLFAGRSKAKDSLVSRVLPTRRPCSNNNIGNKCSSKVRGKDLGRSSLLTLGQRVYNYLQSRVLLPKNKTN